MTDMDKQDKIRLLLQIQEYPENYTDEQLRQLLDNDEMMQLKEELAQTKRAICKHDADYEEIPIDELWQDFSDKHAEELGNLSEVNTAYNVFISRFRRIAAILLTVVCITGIAFAASVRLGFISNPFNRDGKQTTSAAVKNLSRNQELQTTTSTAPAKHSDADSTKAEPVVFDNVTLESMLGKIASYYNIEVEFENNAARTLRFYFEWKHDETLGGVVSRLNLFESVNIVVDGNKIIVK